MLMIGVTPLPALMNSSFAGGGSDEHELALDLATATRSCPAWPPPTRYGDTLPSSTLLGVMLISPSSRYGSDVSEYARQCRTPSMSIPIRTYCPGLWPGQR